MVELLLQLANDHRILCFQYTVFFCFELKRIALPNGHDEVDVVGHPVQGQVSQPLDQSQLLPDLRGQVGQSLLHEAGYLIRSVHNIQHIPVVVHWSSPDGRGTLPPLPIGGRSGRQTRIQ